MTIELSGVSHELFLNGEAHAILDSIDLTIARGEFVCLLGPSGCGKTTLLNALAGFLHLSGGQIRIDGNEVREPSSRRIILFQEYGLLPWRTVLENVALGLEPLPISREERIAIADRHIEMVGLGAFRNRRPAELSGGMRQRVALARALAVNPEVLLMDEPLGALDSLTRLRMQDEIRDIWMVSRPTVVFVTHSIEEALFLADRIVILTSAPGRIQTILPVTIPHPRDRTTTAFLKLRDAIHAELGVNHSGKKGKTGTPERMPALLNASPSKTATGTGRE